MIKNITIRSQRTYAQDIKVVQSIASYVLCDKCNDNRIPVIGNTNPNRVLAAHKSKCNGIKTNRNEVRSEYLATTNHHDDYELMEISSDNGILIECADHNVCNMSVKLDSSNVSSIKSVKPFIECDDRSLFIFQETLDESYLHSTIKINRRAKQEKRASFQDTVELFDLVITENMSNQTTQKLLLYLNNMHKRNDVNIQLPTNFETLRRQCSSGIISSAHANNPRGRNGLFDLQKYSYKLDPDVFPNRNESICAYGYDVKQIIAEFLLNMNPLHFIRKPDERYVSGDVTNRIFEDYTTGYHFKSLSEAVERECKNCTALCIGFTLDDTQIRSGKRTFTPVHMYIANAINDSFKMILVGYAPGDKLPYNAKQMEDYLYKMYPKYDRSTGEIIQNGKKGATEAIVKYHERKFQRDFLYDLFQSILATQENGILLRIGRLNDPSGFEINACIHVGMITCDNMQGEFLASTSLRNKQHQCRICMSGNCQSVDPTVSIGAFRDDEEMQRIGINLEVAIKEECKRTETSQTKETENALKAGREAGIQAGYNKLIDLFKWQYDRKIMGFFKSLAPDYLHTVVKGCVEDAIAWSVCCISALKDHDRKYQNSMKYIDDRIKHFPIIQSLVIFENKPMFRWFEGISHLFKNSMHSKAGNTGYFANGSIEGWKLPQLLFQLIFCINEDICPFAARWAVDKRNLTYKWNVGRQIVNALTSVLMVHFYCRLKVMSETAINTTLTEAIQNARSHMSLLRLMKQDLMSKVALTKEDGVSVAIKPHLLSHIPEYKKLHGADQLITDTEKSELAHKELKVDFEHTNKRYGTALLDMLYNNKVRMHFKYLMSSISASEESSSSEQRPTSIIGTSEEPSSGTSEEPSTMVYETVTTFGTPDLLSIQNNEVTVISTLKYVNKFRSPDLRYAPKIKYTDDSSGINNVLVSFKDVIKFAKQETNVEFARCWKGFEQDQIRCRLIKAVRCYDKAKGKTTEDVIVHCNGHHESTKGSSKAAKNICDFIEVKLVANEDDVSDCNEDDEIDDTSEIARVICIFGFMSNNTIGAEAEVIYFLICWMNKKEILKPILPFPCYVYGLTRDKKYLHLQIVSIKSLQRPAFLVSHAMKGPLYWSDVSKKSVDVLKRQMFYSVPFDIVDRRTRYKGHVDYIGDDKLNSSSSSSSSSSSGSSSSSSSSSSSTTTKVNIIFDELQMALSPEQHVEISRMNDDVSLSSNDKDKKDKTKTKRKRRVKNT